MKLLYLANIRLPTEKAHGVQIMKTCEAFARLGHEVELVIPTRRNPIKDDPFLYYGVERNFKLTTFRVPDFVRFGQIGFLTSMLWFSEKARLRRAFWQADVIYSRDAFVLLQYLLLGRKLVFEAHGPPTPFSRLIARHMYRIIAISKAARESFVAIGVPREKVVVAPDGVDLEAFAHPEPKASARTRLGLSQDKKIALYAGRLDGWKGVKTLCEAAKFLPENVEVAIMGGEPAQITAFQKQYPKVRFLGYRPYRGLPDNQAAADVLVLPNTREDKISMHYTSPLKLFTYMASGVPIVTSDTSATREVLTDDDAYFFKPDDAGDLVKHVEAVFAAPDEANAKAKSAREKAGLYTWQSRAEHILLYINSRRRL